MGNHHSSHAKDLARNDSLLSRNELKASPNAPTVLKKNSSSTVKKIKSLADLSRGPRSAQNISVPALPAPRKASVDSQMPASALSSKNNAANVSAPPRKISTNPGLPSNPRPKTPLSPLHVRGKSSTGFNLFKVCLRYPFMMVERGH